jgi:hypothetical protein
MRRLVTIAALALLGLAGCDDALGPPRLRPAPAPDGVPALLGGGPARSARLASYQIDARLDDARDVIAGQQVLTWTNGGASSVSSMPLHLYLNGFANEATLLMTSLGGRLRGAAASTDGWGWIDVTSIRARDPAGALGPELRPLARFTVDDRTVLEVPLPRAVGPGERIELAMTFTAQLPEVFARTGHRGAFTMVGQWFPKVGVRVGPPGTETWSTLPFHGHAEFFADFGAYDVRVTVPQTHVVAATGVLVDTTDHADGTRTHHYRAEDVHDFAWMTDPYMEVLEAPAQVGEHVVRVRVVHRPAQREFARRHLAAGVGAIEQFSARFGAYPWSIMTIVDPPLDAVDGAGGMEYPTLVTTAGDTALARPGMRLPEFVTIHEIGHNWFQGLLASDERAEPWLDEGVNEWADGVVMAALYGEPGSALDWGGWQAESFRLRRVFTEDPSSLPAPIATAAAAIVDQDTYAGLAYAAPMAALRTVELIVGRDAFARGMRRYAEGFAFRHPTGEDLIAALAAEAGSVDVRALLTPALHELGAVQLRIRDAGCAPLHLPRGRFVDDAGAPRLVTEADAPDRGAWRCHVVIANLGPVPVPVDIETRFADGSVRTDRWQPAPGEHWHRLALEHASPLTEVALDPDRRILLQDQPLELHRRLGGSAAAPLRAGARVGFWAQVVMAGVGL